MAGAAGVVCRRDARISKDRLTPLRRPREGGDPGKTRGSRNHPSGTKIPCSRDDVAKGPRHSSTKRVDQRDIAQRARTFRPSRAGGNPVRSMSSGPPPSRGRRGELMEGMKGTRTGTCAAFQGGGRIHERPCAIGQDRRVIGSRTMLRGKRAGSVRSRMPRGGRAHGARQARSDRRGGDRPPSPRQEDAATGNIRTWFCQPDAARGLIEFRVEGPLL